MKKLILIPLLALYSSIQAQCVVALPTAFTPNKDGLNDTFKAIGSGYIVHDFIIFNRWGNKVFESTNNMGWNGVTNGIEQDPGVYMYYLVYDCNGEEKYIKSTVNLIR
jgi:gliding motility-associated-like protein